MTLLRFYHVPRLLLPSSLFLLLPLILTTLLPSPAVAARGDGYTMSDCEINDDCIPPRVCTYRPNQLASSPCTGQAYCFCAPPNGLEPCQHCSMCHYPNETCLTFDLDLRGSCISTSLLAPPEQQQEPRYFEIGFQCETSLSPTPTPSFTSSPTPTRASPSPSPTPTTAKDGDGGVCVDARVFEKGQPGETHGRLFPTHRTATVLCDHNGSCATPGHIVVYEDRAMTMRRYCSLLRARDIMLTSHTATIGGRLHQQVTAREERRGVERQCESVVMQVNSPKYAPGVRILSKTTGLYFTALAARFETTVEEAVLRTAVRLGL